MHSPVVTVSADATIAHAARLLVLRRVGSLPVLNRRKAIVGIITETDMFKLTAGMLRPRPVPAGRGRRPVARGAAGAKKVALRAKARKT